MKEKIIEIDGVKTGYSIDEFGRVKNIKTSKYLKGVENKGYLCLNIFVRGKAKHCYIHRLVAENFLPNPENKEIVHHKDGNKLNNTVYNLQWVSSIEHDTSSGGNNKGKKAIKIDISDFPGVFFRKSQYFVTENGDIINMNTKRLLRQEQTGKYKRVLLYLPEGKKHLSVHRVVWEAFNGEIEPGAEIDHIDNDPSNNSLSNLQKISHQENCLKAAHGNWKIKRTLKDGTKIIYNSLNQACQEGHFGYDTIKHFLEIKITPFGEIWEKIN